MKVHELQEELHFTPLPQLEEHLKSKHVAIRVA